MTETLNRVETDSFEWINDYVGVPYLVNGRTRAGWDCWGLVLAVYRDRLEIELPDWRWHEPLGLAAKLRSFDAAWRDVEKGAHAIELRFPMDYAIGLVRNLERPHHVGLALGGGVLHAARYGGTLYEPRARFLKTYPSTKWHAWRG